MTHDLGELPQRIYALFNDEVDHELNEENLEAFGRNVVDIVRARFKKRERTEGTLRISNIGRDDRQLWYQHNRPEEAEKTRPQTYIKWLYGDLTEQLMVLLSKEAGYELEREQEEIEVDGVLGHIDGIINGRVVDFKSASPYSFNKFKYGKLYEDDAFGYIGQISGYASILTPDKGGAFIALDKVHGEICVLQVGPTITNSYDVRTRIAYLKEVLALPEPPERCHEDVEDGKSGNRKLGTNCSYCDFKWTCWPELRGFSYSGSPRFLTTVVREPKDIYEFNKEST